MDATPAEVSRFLTGIAPQDVIENVTGDGSNAVVHQRSLSPLRTASYRLRASALLPAGTAEAANLSELRRRRGRQARLRHCG